MKKKIRPSRFELRFQSRWEVVNTHAVLVLVLGAAGAAALYGAGWLILYGVRGAFLPQSMHWLLRAVLGCLLVWAPEYWLYTTGKKLFGIAWMTAKQFRPVFEALRHD